MCFVDLARVSFGVGDGVIDASACSCLLVVVKVEEIEHTEHEAMLNVFYFLYQLIQTIIQ